jgi:exodeoxyribonuclease V alpha subunit
MNVPTDLHAYRRAGVISRDDIAAADLLVAMARRDGADEPAVLAWVGMCLALRTVRDGHTCVDLDRIEEWARDLEPGAPGAPAWPTSAGPWIDALTSAETLVGAAGERRPFLLDGHRLYLARSLAEEASIAAAIRARAEAGTIGILLGGPGTGKTTKVARDLVARFAALAPGEAAPRIALAAPTGKAAARMTEAVRTACQRADAPPDTIDRILAEPARTVHKLLGFHPGRADRFAYHAGHRLPYDIVIVDEASMLSSTLMHHLLAAVRPQAEIRLVGDPDQLASVDAGTVLGDMALFGDAAMFGDGALFRGAGGAAAALHDRIETLHRIYRAESQAILDLAKAIREGNHDAALGILRAGGETVAWIDPAARGGIEGVETVVGGHAAQLREAAHGGDARTILTTKAALQVLCGHREGPMGVAGWNARIEKRLGVRAGDVWYAGRPVIVTRNSRALDLANGDVGVVVPKAGRMEALFGLPDQPVHRPVSRLEDVATVHALTIHKSQGSEYGHAVVVLPERPSRIVTRELLYTGVTRAREKVTLIGSEEVIRAAIARRIRRATGLADRLA